MIPLILGTVTLQPRANLDLTQTYDDIGGASVMRMMSGAAIKQSHWRKIRTTISAGGWLPPGLDGLDWALPMTLSCIAPRCIINTDPNAVLPEGRRGLDAPPFCHALLPRGEWVETPVSVGETLATATPVNGAVGYAIYWYPMIAVYCDPPRVRYDASGAAFGWELTAEEI